MQIKSNNLKKEWNIIDLINWGSNFFSEKGIESPRLNIELLVCHILKCNRLELYMKYDRPLSENELISLREFVKRRAEREPIQYILGEVDFYNLKLKVNPHVLIPRPETENLIELIINSNKNLLQENLKILDICAGSGCIGLALAKEFPHSKVVGIEISEEAIAVARENAQLNKISNIEFIQFDYLNAKKFKTQYDIIVSNPPYVTIKDYDYLEPELKNYEPKIALTDFSDGLSFYKKFVTDFTFLLSMEGRFYFEVGYNQANDIKNLFENKNFNIQIENDYSGIQRFIFGNRKS